MLEAMIAAPVEDDVYGDDLPSMNCSAMPPTRPAKSGAISTTGRPTSLACSASLPARRRVYRRRGAHNYLYAEAGGAAVLGSIQPQPIDAAADGSLPLDKVAAKIKPTISILPHPPAEHGKHP